MVWRSFFFQAEDGIRDDLVTGVQTCALPISGAYDKLADQMKGFEERQVKGFLFNVVYRSQSDPNEVWLVGGFEDEATHRANANEPQTDEIAQHNHQMLVGPPEWHDGETMPVAR